MSNANCILSGAKDLTEAKGRSLVRIAEFKLKVIRANGAIENLGTAAYWHRNPLSRLWWSVKRQLRNAWRNL